MRVCTNKLSRWCIRDRTEMISTLAGQAAAAAVVSVCVAHDCFFQFDLCESTQIIMGIRIKDLDLRGFLQS